MKDESPAPTEAFMAIAEMLGRRGHAPLKGKLITETVGPWVVCLNAQAAPASVALDGTMGCEDVPPHHAVIFFNGWLAGTLSPFDGWIAAGEAANEDSFIKAVRNG
jgi:hypothetical protein